MLNIPLPFVIFLFLLVLLMRLAGRQDRRLLPVIAVVGACAALTVVVGLRWSFQWELARFFQPVLASLLPPLAWLLFADLTDKRRQLNMFVHLVPVALIVFFFAVPSTWLSAIDVILALSFFIYGLALIRVAAAGPDGFAVVRISETVSVKRAAFVSGLVLVFSGAIDLVVAGELVLSRGGNAETIIVAVNLITLPLLAYAVSFVGEWLPSLEDTSNKTRSGAGVDQPTDNTTTAAVDKDIVVAIDRLIRTRQLFRDPELTLDRLARKAMIPTRHISGAINRVLGKNMSQFVNSYRIEEAKRLLLETDQPVTTIMFEAGFQTKSNFNHEFRRALGQSPSDFRRSSSKTE